MNVKEAVSGDEAASFTFQKINLLSAKINKRKY